MKGLNEALLKFLSNKMAINLNVFRSFMKHWVGLDAIYKADLLSQCRGIGSIEGWPGVLRIDVKQSNSHVVSPKALYSDSLEDFETVTCFLHFQETYAEPSIIQYPVREHLVSRQPPQSASQSKLVVLNHF